jgi:hypothetical protein
VVNLRFQQLIELSGLLVEPFHIWRRHWVLTSFLLVLVFVGTGAAVLKVPRTYQAESTVVLLASRNSSKVAGDGNPYLSFSDALSTTASVISTEIMDPQTAANLKAQGFSESYQVVSQSTLSNISLLPAPFLLVTVTGHSRLSVEHTLHGVTDEIATLMNGLQAGLSRDNRILLITASFDPRATLSVTSTARPLVGVLGLLLIVALGLPLVVDAAGARRGIRRGTRRESLPASARWEAGARERIGHREPRSVTPERRGESLYGRLEEERVDLDLRPSSEGRKSI